jgi:hypothetical protein
MTVFSLGPLYVGLQQESAWYVCSSSAARSIHLGRVLVELDRPKQRFRGSTQADANGSAHGSAAESV